MEKQPEPKKSKKKWWLIGCSGIVGLFIIIIVIAAIAGSSEDSESTSNVTTPMVGTLSQEGTASTPNYSTHDIVITYSSTVMSQLGIGYLSDKPKSGFVYLVLDMTIENRSVDSFSTNSLYFSVVINKIKYSYALVSQLENELALVNILKGGTVQGKLAFEVPTEVTTTGFQIVYERPFTSYDIEWVNN